MLSVNSRTSDLAKLISYLISSEPIWDLPHDLALRHILLDKKSIILRDSSLPHMGSSHRETCVAYHNYKSFPKLQALNSGQHHLYKSVVDKILSDPSNEIAQLFH